MRSIEIIRRNEPRNLKALLRIQQESELLKEVKDILDEIMMIRAILAD